MQQTLSLKPTQRQVRLHKQATVLSPAHDLSISSQAKTVEQNLQFQQEQAQVAMNQVYKQARLAQECGWILACGYSCVHSIQVGPATLGSQAAVKALQDLVPHEFIILVRSGSWTTSQLLSAFKCGRWPVCPEL
jgi:hypothetical protein